MIATRQAGKLLRGVAAAKYLGIGRKTFYDLVHAGHIPVWVDPLTGTKRCSTLALDRWLEDLGRDGAA